MVRMARKLLCCFFCSALKGNSVEERKQMDRQDTSCGSQHNYLSDNCLDFTGFKFSEYLKGEDEILTPQLIKAGYIIKRYGWFSEDFDSSGPLVRAIDVITPAGVHGRITYG